MKILAILMLFFTSTSFASSTYLIQGSLQQTNGTVYIGGVDSGKTKFDSYTLEAQLVNSSNILFGVSYDNFTNNRSVNTSQLGVNFGYNFNFDKLNWSVYGGPGLAEYREESELQQINTSSLGLSLATSVSFEIWEGLFAHVNYRYTHQMFTDGISFWGSNPRSDVVFSNHGIGVGLGWRWK